MKRQTKSKVQRGLVTQRIVYVSRERPHARHQELRVDVRRGTVIDVDYATALVAVRMSLALDEVRIVRVEAC